MQLFYHVLRKDEHAFKFKLSMTIIVPSKKNKPP